MRQLQIFKHLTLLLGIVFMSKSAFALSTTHFQTFLDHWRVDNQVTSVVISVDDLATHQIKNFTSGTITLDDEAPTTINTLYGIGSISKTFVSAAILQLQREEKLKLDDPIGPYFPMYPRWSQVTIRQLLNMTSGIYNFTEAKEFNQLQASRPKNKIPATQLMDIAYQQPDYFAPGKGWHYSNTNYFLAGLIIEKITHQPLEAVYEERFFKPLHLKHTYYSDLFYSKAIEKNMAHAYKNGIDITYFNAGLPGAAGAMIMNSQDLLTWAEALFTSEKVLTKNELVEFETAVPIPPSPPKPLGASYGLGIYSLDMPKIGMIWYYAGVGFGYSSVFVWIPSQNKIIVAQVASYKNIALLFPNHELLQAIVDLRV